MVSWPCRFCLEVNLCIVRVLASGAVWCLFFPATLKQPLGDLHCWFGDLTLLRVEGKWGFPHLWLLSSKPPIQTTRLEGDCLCLRSAERTALMGSSSDTATSVQAASTGKSRIAVRSVVAAALAG